jgi:multidrug efflux pump subunit AcrA (membrane-fusion protein)
VPTVEFRPYQEIDVMAKVAGYIKRIDVDVGDRVREGQLLATLEIPEMEDDLRRAQAALDRGSADNPIVYSRIGSGLSIGQMVTDFGRTAT